MFARVRIFKTSPEGIEQGSRYFSERVLPAAGAIHGFGGALFLVDRDTNTAIGITLWKDEASLAESGALGASMQQERDHALAPTEQTLGIFEVTAQA